MYSFQFSQLLTLFVLVAQALAAVRYIRYSDGTHGWFEDVRVGRLTAQQVRNEASVAWHDMDRDARVRRMDTPSVMSAVYLPQYNYLILASSLKGARHREVSVATVNYCANQQ